LSDEISKFFETIPLQKIEGIGIGAPMANHFTGFIEDAHNLPWHNNINIVKLLKNNFNTPIVLSNDANAAAIGEMVYGNAKDLDNFIVITLGTGVGAGIVINKKILLGASGYAGEIGHTTAIIEGRQCNCGRKGCLETYCSANGIIETAKELIEKNNDSLLHGIQNLSTIDIYNAAIKGDKVSNEVFNITGKILGYQLAQATLITSPSHIFIFGGVANAKDLILNPIRNSFYNNLLNVFKSSVKIELSGLPQGNAAILGAASLVL